MSDLENNLLGEYAGTPADPMARICPLVLPSSYPVITCIGEQCAWWAGECALTKIARLLGKEARRDEP